MLYKEALEKAAAFKLKFHGKGVPVHRQLWKWITANSRANKLGLRHALAQQAELPDVNVKDLVKQMGLPDSWKYNISMEPITAANHGRTGYNFSTEMITNRPPGSLVIETNPSVKLTDMLKHEIGHAKTHLSGAVDLDRVVKSKKPSVFTAVHRLLHPQDADLVRIEDMADMEAFGSGGKLSWHKQLRHHPEIAGYRAVARMIAAGQLAGVTAGLGANGYLLYRKINNIKQKRAETTGINNDIKED